MEDYSLWLGGKEEITSCSSLNLQEHKVLLTGTPLQNTVEELFSLLNFLEPERFPSEQTFMTEFGDLKTEEQVRRRPPPQAFAPPWFPE